MSSLFEMSMMLNTALAESISKVLEHVGKCVERLALLDPNGGDGGAKGDDEWMETASNDSDHLIMGGEFGMEDFGLEVIHMTGSDSIHPFRPQLRFLTS